MILCDAYHDGFCWGTKEIDPCSCDGDRTKCSFYPDVLEKAKKQEVIEPCSADKYPDLWQPVIGKSAEEILKHIYEIALDWDGYRTAKGLGELVDEILACCCAPRELHRPLEVHEVITLPIGTLIWVEHSHHFDDLDQAEVYNGNPGDGYGRFYRYWRIKPTQEECLNAKWNN